MACCDNRRSKYFSVWPEFFSSGQSPPFRTERRCRCCSLSIRSWRMCLSRGRPRRRPKMTLPSKYFSLRLFSSIDGPRQRQVTTWNDRIFLLIEKRVAFRAPMFWVWRSCPGCLDERRGRLGRRRGYDCRLDCSEASMSMGFWKLPGGLIEGLSFLKGGPWKHRAINDFRPSVLGDDP